MIRYGILGMASISPRFIKGIQLSKRGRVEAIYSSRILDELDVKHYNTIEALLEDEQVDVVYIPTPNYVHAYHIKLALEANKHVICEKPFVLSSKDAKELFKLAWDKGLFLMEAQKIVFLPLTLWLKDHIQEETFGSLKCVSMSMWFAEGSDKSHWMYDELKGGGVTYGSASYPIEYTMFLLDSLDIEPVNSKITKGETGVDEIVEFEYETKGVTIQTKISRLNVIPNEARFYFEDAEVVIPNFWKADKVYINDELVQSFPFESEFKYEVDHINACIKAGMLVSSEITPEMTIKCIEYVEHIKENAIYVKEDN